MDEGRIRLKEAPEIAVALKRSPRARRLSLRVSSLDGRVTLTVPNFVGREEALAFAEERTGWIADAVARVPGAVAVDIGARIPVEGRLREIVSGPRPRIHDDAILVPGARAAAATRGLLRTLARDRLAVAADRYSARIGRPYTAITLRDTRSRWGSCTTDGRLMFSWRLAMAPPEVLDYVAAHEVAHLVHMDHSPAFWSAVASLRPDWRLQRDWLRGEGAGLHRYAFGD